MGTETGAYFALCANDIIARSGMGGQRMNSRRLPPPLPFLRRALLPGASLAARRGHERTTARDWGAGLQSKLKQITTSNYSKERKGDGDVLVQLITFSVPKLTTEPSPPNPLSLPSLGKAQNATFHFGCLVCFGGKKCSKSTGTI